MIERACITLKVGKLTVHSNLGRLRRLRSVPTLRLRAPRTRHATNLLSFLRGLLEVQNAVVLQDLQTA